MENYKDNKMKNYQKPCRKIEYQVIYREGEDVDTFDNLRDAETEYKNNPEATELRKVIWTPKKYYHGEWIPLNLDAEREDITIKEKIK